MPWATNGKISTDPIEGGLEISDEQYSLALDGILSGKLVSIVGGFSVLDPPAPEPEPPVDPLSVPLPRLTFWLAASEIGVYKPLVRANIEAMPDGPAKYQAIVWFEEATVYRRNDPLLIQLAAAEGISEPQLDALWLWALGDT